MAMLNSVPRHPGCIFSWAYGEGCADASDFSNPPPGAPPLCGRVWDDACDVGFFVVSHRTQESKLFTHSKSVRDPFGELLYDVYTSHPDRVVQIRIYND